MTEFIRDIEPQQLRELYIEGYRRLNNAIDQTLLIPGRYRNWSPNRYEPNRSTSVLPETILSNEIYEVFFQEYKYIDRFEQILYVFENGKQVNTLLRFDHIDLRLRKDDEKLNSTPENLNILAELLEQYNDSVNK